MSIKVLCFMMPIVLVCNPLLLGCTASKGDEEREKFVVQFIDSVYGNTEFYKQYVETENRVIIEEARSKLTQDYEIYHRDEVGPGSYEYGVRFENGATAVVTVDEPKQRTRWVSLIINDQPGSSDR